MPLPISKPPLSPLKRTLLAAAAALIFLVSYAAYTVATFDYPKWLKITSGCIMPVTVVSAGEAGASVVRIQATTGSGEAIEVTGKSRPAAGEQITVWRTTGPDGGFIYEMLEDIPPMRK